MLIGGGGNDTFTYFKKDFAAGEIDTIADFAAGDRLDLRDILKSLSYDAIADVLHVADGADGTLVSVRIGDGFASVAMLAGVHGVDADALLADGMLLV